MPLGDQGPKEAASPVRVRRSPAAVSTALPWEDRMSQNARPRLSRLTSAREGDGTMIPT